MWTVRLVAFVISFTSAIVALSCLAIVLDVSADGPDLMLSISPASAMVVAGQNLTFRVGITNTGSATLESVGVTNSSTTACDRSIGTLQPGDAITYTCGTASLWHNLTNVITVTGNAPGNSVISASSIATVQVIRPQVFQHQYPDPIYVMNGADAVITIAFTNTGDITLTNAKVDDPLVPDCARSLGTLPPGVGLWYSCVAQSISVPFYNQTSGSAQPPVGRLVKDDDISTIIPVQPVDGAAILIEQDPARTVVQYGSFAKFYMAVINPGNITVAHVLVTNTLVPDCNRTFSQLGPGQIAFYTCTRQNPPTSFLSTVNVSAQPLGSNASIASSDSDLLVMANYILAVGYMVNTATVPSGGVLTYTLEAKNITTPTATSVVMSATLPARASLLRVSGGSYSGSLGAPGLPGVYWQGTITGNTAHALVMSVRVSEVAGLITSTGTATTDGQLILADTAISRVMAPHRTQLPTVMR